MFAQTIRARTSDPAAVRAAMQRWVSDLAPGARGWLGTTSGVTDDGQLFVLARFESEEAARANSNRPEQDAFWSEIAQLLDGEATFEDSTDVFVYADDREVDDAEFVQVMFGRNKDLARSNELMSENLDAMARMRPDIIASVTIGHDGDRYTGVIYFTNEAEAREREKQDAPADAGPMQEMMSLEIGEPEFLDLREPWLHSPASS